MTTDPRLLKRAVAGEESACRTLVERHGPLVFGLCRRLAHEPEDVYQEVWEKVFRRLSTFDPSGSAPFRAWLAVITRRHLIDHHRRVRRVPHAVSLEGVPSSQPSVESTVSGREQLRKLEEALARLPDEQRRVLVGHHVYGVSLQDLAEEEGVAVGTIKSRLHRGRARLPHHLRRS